MLKRKLPRNKPHANSEANYQHVFNQLKIPCWTSSFLLNLHLNLSKMICRKSRLTRSRAKLSGLIKNVEELASTFSAGRLLRDGLKVTLVGRPNVGKSSLFNGLLALDRAIVTDVPGTTRDSLSEMINLQGVPVLLTDTAGVRDFNG